MGGPRRSHSMSNTVEEAGAARVRHLRLGRREFENKWRLYGVWTAQRWVLRWAWGVGRGVGASFIRLIRFFFHRPTRFIVGSVPRGGCERYVISWGGWRIVTSGSEDIGTPGEVWDLQQWQLLGRRYKIHRTKNWSPEIIKTFNAILELKYVTMWIHFTCGASTCLDDKI